MASEDYSLLNSIKMSLEIEHESLSKNPYYIQTIQENCFSEIQRENFVIWINNEFYNQLPIISFRTKELAIIYLDLYLSRKKCSPEQFELLGSYPQFQFFIYFLILVTLVFISMKMEERFPITLNQLSNIIENKVIQVSEIQAMELKILQTLDWQLNIPTPGEYAREFIKYLFPDEDQQMNIVENLDDFMSYQFLKFKSSEIALTCILLILEQVFQYLSYQPMLAEKVFTKMPVNQYQIEQCFQSFVSFVSSVEQSNSEYIDEEITTNNN